MRRTAILAAVAIGAGAAGAAIGALAVVVAIGIDPDHLDPHVARPVRRQVCDHGWLTGPGPGRCTAGCDTKERTS